MEDVEKINFRNTVLIIGAGAHKPYGMPTSEELTNRILGLLPPKHADLKRDIHHEREKICSLLQSQNVCTPIIKGFPDLKPNWDLDKCRTQLDLFLRSFGRSGVQSIDVYLSKKLASKSENMNYQGVETIGKLLIAYFITAYEDEEYLAHKKKDWIHYLIHVFLRHEELCDLFFKAPPRIITFNYDNLFEKIIYNHLVEFHGKTPSDAIKMVKSLKIKHVHGDIGSLEADSEKTPEYYENAIRNIKVIGEKSEDKEEKSTEIGEWLEDETREVFFLGFGFDPSNMEVLLKGQHTKLFDRQGNRAIRICATNVGMGEAEMRAARGAIRDKTKRDKVGIAKATTDCITLMKDLKLFYKRN